MAKRRSSSSKKSNERQSVFSRIIAVITTIIVGIIFIIAQILGIGGDSGGGTDTPGTEVAGVPGSVSQVTVGQGFGARKGFWDVYFTAPTGNSDVGTYVNGIDAPLVRAIDGVRNTLDIAAFELNNTVITDAILEAKQRGVRVRIVADNEHTIEDDDSTMEEIEDAGIPVTYDNRSAFMHNKFMIMDGSVVWTGSTNYTMNDVYRNNNNMVAMRSRRAVEIYQNEFNQMFTGKVFGPRKQPYSTSFTQDGTAVQIHFAPAAEVLDALNAELNRAESTIRFMAFSFTEDSVGDVLLEKANRNVRVEGIFETRGSETEFSELTRLQCAGLDVRQDGNKYTLHHKVFIVDNSTVITGSFNFSANATQSNDENLVVIRDPDLVAQYVAEYERLKRTSVVPNDLGC